MPGDLIFKEDYDGNITRVRFQAKWIFIILQT